MKNLILLFIIPFSIFGKSPDLTNDDLKSTPPKIIRTCCSFGNELKLAALPFIKFTDITSFEQLGQHKYLGSDAEMNGIVYTNRGGFVDIAHLRDIADWTAYLYKIISKTKADGLTKFELKLGYEGGSKKLVLKIPSDFSEENTIKLAGKIAYDISVWHEIATWYGNSYLPLVPERYSAFSVEDAYSNLLGAHVGMEAIKSELPYEEAVTKILKQKLIDLQPVKSYKETVAAMEKVKDIWWTDKANLPSGKVLLKREFVVYGDSLSPRLLPEMSDIKAVALAIYSKTDQGQDMNDYYDIKIKLNHKFPYRKIFSDPSHPLYKKQGRTITQRDFQTLISAGTSQNRKKFPIDKYQF